MAFAQIPSYPAFDCRSEDIAIRWNKWVNRLTNNLFVAYGIADEERKKALLLTYGGDDLCDIVEAMPVSEITPAEGESCFDKIVAALNSHFNPRVNKEIQRYKFRHMKQDTDTIDDFYNMLKQLAPSCDFHNVDDEIKSQLITGCKSDKVREKGLTTPTLPLHELLQFARTSEITQKHARTVHSEELSASMNKLSVGRKNIHQQRTTKQKCRNCGKEWPHPGGQKNCPARGKSCSTCDKPNHFSSVCRSKPVPHAKPRFRRQNSKRHGRKHRIHNLEGTEGSESDSDHQDSEQQEHYVYMSRNRMMNAMPFFEVSVNGKSINVLADSGASLNIMNRRDFLCLHPKPTLTPCKTKIYAFSSTTPLSILGKFRSNVHYNNIEKEVDFTVMNTDDTSIIGWQAAQNLMMINKVNFTSRSSSDKSNDNILSQYKDVFTGVGKLKDYKVKLHIDENVTPIAQKYRRIPFHIRQQLEEYLEREERLGIIEKSKGATPWVSPIVIVPKPKSPEQIRVCIDMRAPNTAIQRERHNVPTLDELTTMLSGARVFSKLDLNQGYNQLELHEDSRYITTFATHKGLYQYKRLNFGVNSASEMFQEAIRQTLNGLAQTINVSDDILVFGKNQEEHDRNLENLLKRLRDKNLTLNKKKCQFNKTTVEFLGHIFSEKGIQPSPSKIKAIRDMPSPQSPSEVRSLLGMLNFCGARFIQDYATKTHELRKLTQSKTPFKWTEKHEQSLQVLKCELDKRSNLVYFNPNKETQLFVDASPVGISGILTQSTKHLNDIEIVQFASRALTPTEQRYSQTEREALAITWSCEHFHIYLYGSPGFTVFTDHKPLVALFGNPKTRLPARIERWVLRTQSYNLKITYRPGKDNPADYMSRHPAANTAKSSREQQIAEEFVNYLTDKSIPKAMTLEQVINETSTDALLQDVIKAIKSNRWYHVASQLSQNEQKMFTLMEKISYELSVTEDGILLKGNKIVLPQSLQKQAIDLAHSGHQGRTKTIALLREKTWFPQMSKAVENAVKNCLPCQIATPTTTREPVQMSQLPNRIWSELSADFAHLPNGEQLLIIIDEYSRYPVIDILKSTSAFNLIPKLDKIFSEFGIPDQLKTDNGPPFNGSDFSKYMRHMGIHHRKITPLWPRANGETERFVRTVKKSIKAALSEDKNWKQEMYKFLLSYRATPHSSTNLPPAKILFGRNLKTKLPEHHSMQTTQAPDDTMIRQNDTSAKARMKAYADKKCFVRPSSIKIDDNVLVKDTTKIRPSTPYEPKPYIVTEKKGSMITASREHKSITRNSSFFKKSPRPPTFAETEEDNSEDTLIELSEHQNIDSYTPQPLQMETTMQASPEIRPAHRPRRDRHLPAKYKDYVLS